MRNLAVLMIGALALSWFVTSAKAQNFGGSAPQGESVVYTLELTEQMMMDLRNGLSLRSEIPAHLRNKVTEIRLRFIPTNLTADRANGQPVSNRADSNQFGSQPSTSGNPVMPPANSIPRFTPPPAQSTIGNQTQTGRSEFNSVLGPANALNQGQAVSQHQHPIGPPVPNPTIPGFSQSRLQPTNPGLYQPPNQVPTQTPTQTPTQMPTQRPTQTPTQIPPYQPANQYLPPPPADHQMRPSTTPPSAATGNEFDTTDHNRQHSNQIQPPASPTGYGNANAWNGAPNQPRPFAPVQSGYSPSTGPRNSQVAGHDRPTIPIQSPHLAARQGPQGIFTQPGHVNQNLAASIPGSQNTDGEYVASNHGPNGVTTGSSPVAQLNKFNQFLFFLLFCSIGLNIYLAWISRGFYVRYRELADELRETFSTAI